MRAANASVCSLLSSLVWLSSGCGHSAALDTSLLTVEQDTNADKLPGKALIITSEFDDERIRRICSSSCLEIPVDKIVGAAAVATFGAIYSDGASWLHSPTEHEQAAHAIIVHPRVTSFSWELQPRYGSFVKLRRFLGDPVDQHAEISVAISLSVHGPEGRLIMSRDYASGLITADTLYRDPVDDVGPAVHIIVRDLMLRALVDFATETAREARLKKVMDRLQRIKTTQGDPP